MQLVKSNQELHKASGIATQVSSVAELMALPAEQQGLALMRYLKGKTVDQLIADRNQEQSLKEDLIELSRQLNEARALEQDELCNQIIERGKSVTEQLNSLAVEPLLSKLDEADAFVACGVMLEDCYEFFGLAPGAKVIETQAYLIVCEFGHLLNATEVGMILRDGKAGKYGKLYGKLDAPQLVSWIKEYLAIRQEKYANQNLNRHLANRPASDAPRKSGTLRELIRGGDTNPTQPK